MIFVIRIIIIVKKILTIVLEGTIRRDFFKSFDHCAPVAQMADIGFKVVLLERLNQKWKQKHF